MSLDDLRNRMKSDLPAGAVDMGRFEELKQESRETGKTINCNVLDPLTGKVINASIQNVVELTVGELREACGNKPKNDELAAIKRASVLGLPDQQVVCVPKQEVMYLLDESNPSAIQLVKKPPQTAKKDGIVA